VGRGVLSGISAPWLPATRRALIGIALLISSAALFSSCSAARVYVGVARARNDYARGEYQAANRRLIAVSGFQAFAPWISYDLGTVYYALGEPAAAAETWIETDPSVSVELAFRREFNLGVLDYESGAFSDAYDRFRAALALDPGSIEAKINLELSLERTREEVTLVPKRSLSPPGPDVDRLLQYVERLELREWFSTDRIEPVEGARDW
jgi:tetratricopeptide (TPR) repeat protein